MRILAILLAATVVACGGDSMSPPAALSGTYALQTLDGQALPFRYYAETGRELYVVAGSMEFSGTNTATLTDLGRQHDVAPNPEKWTDLIPRVVTLTYTRDGDNLMIETSSELVPSAGLSFSVSADGSTVTLDFPIDSFFHFDGNHRYVFRRSA
jgi:hypothetical protein